MADATDHDGPGRASAVVPPVADDRDRPEAVPVGAPDTGLIDLTDSPSGADDDAGALDLRGASTDGEPGQRHGWPTALGLALYLAGLGIAVVGLAVEVDLPLGTTLRVAAVVIGLLVLWFVAALDRRFVAGLAVVAIGVAVIAQFDSSPEHRLFANLANLREDPGLAAPRVLQLEGREDSFIEVDEASETDGWFLVTVDDQGREIEGWLFGAFIRGLEDYSVGRTFDNTPAVLLDDAGVPTGERNASTNRVLITGRSGDLFEVLTASGTTRFVAAATIQDFS